MVSCGVDNRRFSDNGAPFSKTLILYFFYLGEAGPGVVGLVGAPEGVPIAETALGRPWDATPCLDARNGHAHVLNRT